MDNKTEEKNITKQIETKISKKIFVNLIIAISIMAYFCIMSLIYKRVQQEGMINIVKIFTMIFLGISIVLMEIAYRKESKKIFIYSMETLVLAIHSLTTMYAIKLYNFDFKNYILASAFMFAIYYVLKTIIISTKAQKEYLNSLSDIAEIVKKDEPSKKEATKKEIVEEEEKEEKVESHQEVEEKPKRKRGRPKKEVKVND